MSLKIGELAPDFKLQNQNKDLVTLSSKKGKNVLILFYPLAFSSVCTDELCSVRDNMKFYNAFDAEVLGISVDSLFVQGAFKKAQNINYDLLSDFNKEASKAYGVLNPDFFGMHGVSNRAAFVVDKEGKLQYIEILEDASKQPDFKKIQKVLTELE